ncbi:MAG: hypothetical protein ACKV2T_39310 [Kofleriaceae bacterium]
MARTLILLVVLATIAEPVRAQPAASAEADALFDQGRKLLEQKKIAEACTAFAASQRVSPLVSTQMNLADCREQNQELASAYGLWRDVERQTRAPIDDMKRMNKFALERVKALHPRLSKLTIHMAAPDRVPGLDITRNDAPFDLLLLGQELPADRGTYTVVARAPGFKSVTVSVDIAPERDSKVVHLPPLEPLPREPAAVPGKTAVEAVVAARPAQPPSQSVPFVVGGAGVVLIGTALGLDLWARSQYDDATREPDDLRQEDLWSGARTKRYLAQGLAVVGVAAVGAGAWLFVRARSYERRHAVVAPTFEADGGESRAGLVVFGSF